MRWSVKQFELSDQRRDTQIGLGALEVRLKCVQLVSSFRQPLERAACSAVIGRLSDGSGEKSRWTDPMGLSLFPKIPSSYDKAVSGRRVVAAGW